ncbi:UvrD-helicase domain-containing protein [Pantoea ananatis]|uniref:UvrD-helicase domain-containing protein n=1 Tax=Pantoea ananas TaxID=553 RepID=UPI0039B9CF0C
MVERGLRLGQILAVTFTEAATQELRRRIRERLALAASLVPDSAPEPRHRRLPRRVGAAGAYTACCTRCAPTLRSGWPSPVPMPLHKQGLSCRTPASAAASAAPGATAWCRRRRVGASCSGTPAAAAANPTRPGTPLRPRGNKSSAPRTRACSTSA